MSEHTLDSHWEDDHGTEWRVKVYFDYQPVESAEYGEGGMMIYPGCDSEVTITDVKADFGFGFDSCLYLLNEKELDGYKMECFSMMEDER